MKNKSKKAERKKRTVMIFAIVMIALMGGGIFVSSYLASDNGVTTTIERYEHLILLVDYNETQYPNLVLYKFGRNGANGTFLPIREAITDTVNVSYVSLGRHKMEGKLDVEFYDKDCIDLDEQMFIPDEMSTCAVREGITSMMTTNEKFVVYLLQQGVDVSEEAAERLEGKFNVTRKNQTE